MAPHFHATAPRLSNYAPQSQLLDDLLVAIEDKKVTDIVYRSQRATEPVTYEVCPLGIVRHRSSLYLVADSRSHGEVRNFKVNRIEEVTISPFPFRPPADFNLGDFFSGSFGVYQESGEPVLVRIRFSAEVARYVSEGEWHSSQKLLPQSDGGLILELELTSLKEIKSWVLSFGQHAEALAPAGLREEVAGVLTSAILQYNHPATLTPPGQESGGSGKAKARRKGIRPR